MTKEDKAKYEALGRKWAEERKGSRVGPTFLFYDAEEKLKGVVKEGLKEAAVVVCQAALRHFKELK